MLIWTNLQYIWCKFSTMITKIGTGTATDGAIWDEFSE